MNRKLVSLPDKAFRSFRFTNQMDLLYKLDSYGYDDAVVAGASTISFQPQVGEVFIFNTRNYHIVEPIEGHRVTFTSALGLLPNGEIIFWS